MMISSRSPRIRRAKARGGAPGQGNALGVRGLEASWSPCREVRSHASPSIDGHEVASPVEGGQDLVIGVPEPIPGGGLAGVEVQAASSAPENRAPKVRI